MTKEKIDGYKNKLQQEKTLIIQEIKDLDRLVNFGDDIDHGEEKGDEATVASDHFGEENDLKKNLNEIDAALEKIEAGNYGRCESCGKEIEEEVLVVSPESLFCKECKIKN